MSICVIGTMYDISGDAENPTVTAKAGWHVNSTEPVPEWAQWQVYPGTPRRVFAGVDTYHYCFEIEQQFNDLTPEGE